MKTPDVLGAFFTVEELVGEVEGFLLASRIKTSDVLGMFFIVEELVSAAENFGVSLEGLLF